MSCGHAGSGDADGGVVLAVAGEHEPSAPGADDGVVRLPCGCGREGRQPGGQGGAGQPGRIGSGGPGQLGDDASALGDGPLGKALAGHGGGPGVEEEGGGVGWSDEFQGGAHYPRVSPLGRLACACGPAGRDDSGGRGSQLVATGQADLDVAGGGVDLLDDPGGEGRVLAAVGARQAPCGALDCWMFFGQCLFVLQAAFVKSRKSLSTSSGVRYPRAE